jgi:hypothetical protein
MELALRADMLVRLEEAGALSATGLDLSRRPDLSYDQYRAIGVLLGRATAAIRWAVGYWLAFGEDRFGELAAEASEALGISPEGRMELVRVARAIPRRRRRAALPWGAHRVVAARWIDPRTRDALLDKAEKSAWTVRELEGAVRAQREVELGLHVEAPAAPVTCDADEIAAIARAELMACGFPADVEVLIRAAGVEVRVGP